MTSSRINKNWGYYEDIFRAKFMVMKKLVVRPGESISLQYHNNREELWGIASGTGQVILGNMTLDVSPGQCIRIFKKEQHRLINTGNEDIVVFETQFGECDENDIVRLEDKYGRTT